VDDDERLALLERLNRQFAGLVPHNRALGLELLSLSDGEALVKLPWAAHLVGNPETGVVHGGVITSLLDACAGAAVFMKLQQPIPIATLDLRVDYFKPATPREPVQARCFCTKMTRNVAFVRGLAFHEESDPVASVTGTFMIGTRLWGSAKT
jgi:uncharacterized protein (TIGR00369 family)